MTKKAQKKPHPNYGRPCIGPRTKHPGITQAARDLGCSRIHLWHVLNGTRQSRRLTARYREYQKTLKNNTAV